MKSQNLFYVKFSILLAVAGLLLVFFWRQFWFLTDDAYISFRYVSNSILGYGYVWNPPPFRPVEGYTNFLWVVLLDIVWRILGISPPESANYISLVFSYLTLVTGSFIIIQINWNPTLCKYRVLFVGLFLFGVMANRTFIAWTSSGLETAMMNFLIIVWVYFCIFVKRTHLVWPFAISFTASLISLTRPDGLLYGIATLFLILFLWLDKRNTISKKWLLAASPLLLILFHLGWRLKTYGEWLPNTFYAKQVAIWPESGIRYAISFLLEYALWFWMVPLLLFTFKKLLSIRKSKNYPDHVCGLSLYLISRLYRKAPLILGIVILTIIAHASYYTLIVGGDHFEYRPYSFLIPCIFISFMWFLNKAGGRVLPSVVMLLVFIFLSCPVPWTHWALTHRLTTREETFVMRVPICEQWPKYIHWYTSLFDRIQFWLIEHRVCMRHQEHKIFHQHILNEYPSREEGLLLPSDNFPVHATYCVGVAGWVLPKVNIIDIGGLNDYIIARTPVGKNKFRHMAHDRFPPEGYVESFSPNVIIRSGQAVVLARREPLTAASIIECEKKWDKKIKEPEARSRLSISHTFAW